MRPRDLAEFQNQNRIGLVRFPMRAAPRLDDHPIGNNKKVVAAELTAPCRKLSADLSAELRFSSRCLGVLL